MNRRLVLNVLRREAGLSRLDIAESSGLSPATVGFVVSDLIRENYVLEGETSRGKGGRRPVPLHINYAGHVTIGIKMNVGRLEGVLTDLSTLVLASDGEDLSDHSPAAVLAAASALAERLAAKSPKGIGPLTGIGFSMPASVDAVRGVCVRSHRFGWRDVPFASMLRGELNVPVWLEDDTLAFTLAHKLLGIGRSHRSFGALAVGAGIACGTVYEGTVNRGAHGSAGKLGHVLHAEGGNLCECGRRGCLQAHYAEPALLRRWAGGGGDAEILRARMRAAVADGEPGALALLAEAGDAIGRHLADFVTLTDPEIVVVGGEVAAFGEPFVAPLRASMARSIYETPPAIVIDEGALLWTAGAAALATQRLFDFERAVAVSPEAA